ncbi:hypothetical protein CR513_33176, partial [Mucuna pruriens]
MVGLLCVQGPLGGQTLNGSTYKVSSRDARFGREDGFLIDEVIRRPDQGPSIGRFYDRDDIVSNGPLGGRTPVSKDQKGWLGLGEYYQETPPLFPKILNEFKNESTYKMSSREDKFDGEDGCLVDGAKGLIKAQVLADFVIEMSANRKNKAIRIGSKRVYSQLDQS